MKKIGAEKNDSEKEFVALLLAAGLGTRLRPLTNQIPKCLVKVGGNPVLRIWINKLRAVGCRKIIINTHYKSEMVEQAISDWDEARGLVIIRKEETLRGTGGTFIDCLEEFDAERGMLIHADNLMEESLVGLINAKQNSPTADMTLLTFKTQTPKNCGIVETTKEGWITSFTEKPSDPKSNIASGAVCIFEKTLIEKAKNLTEVSDFSRDILEKINMRMKAYMTKGFFYDIGTIQSLRAARMAVGPNVGMIKYL
mgnify:CR=1 FL=1